MPYAIVRELPEPLQRALEAVGYGRKDVCIEAKETESLFVAGGDGYQGFAVLVSLETGVYEVHRGSWGGGNPFNPTNSVDLNDKEYQLPRTGAVIKGSRGGGRPVYATITLHPENMIKALPEAVELTSEEQSIMYAFGALRSGPYRKGLTEGKGEVIDRLVERGLLKKNAASAVQITTAGRNARKRNGTDQW